MDRRKIRLQGVDCINLAQDREMFVKTVGVDGRTILKLIIEK
jgi:hypothetical protein